MATPRVEVLAQIILYKGPDFAGIARLSFCSF